MIAHAFEVVGLVCEFQKTGDYAPTQAKSGMVRREQTVGKSLFWC